MSQRGRIGAEHPSPERGFLRCQQLSHSCGCLGRERAGGLCFSGNGPLKHCRARFAVFWRVTCQLGAGTAFANQLPTASSPARGQVWPVTAPRPEHKIPQRLSDALSITFKCHHTFKCLVIRERLPAKRSTGVCGAAVTHGSCC